MRLSAPAALGTVMVLVSLSACDGSANDNEPESAYVHIEVLGGPGQCDTDGARRSSDGEPGPRCNLSFMTGSATAYDEFGGIIGVGDFDVIDLSGEGSFMWLADIDTKPTDSTTLTVKVPGCGRPREFRDGDTINLALRERRGQLICAGLTPGT